MGLEGCSLISALDVLAKMTSTEKSCWTLQAASQILQSSVSLETIPVVPGGHLRPEDALGLMVSRRTVLGGMHTSDWVKMGQMSSGRSFDASVKCGPEASMACLLYTSPSPRD